VISFAFYEVEQDDFLFVPKVPYKLSRLPRNILYPFYVYGDATITLPALFMTLCATLALLY